MPILTPPYTTLRLIAESDASTFSFASFEIPESITWGTSHRKRVHDLIGGKRVINRMGPVPKSLTWAGLLTDTRADNGFEWSTAVARAQYLESLAVSGATQSLLWDNFRYSVIVCEFTADYQVKFRIPYTIECEVIQNNTQRLSGVPDPPIDYAIANDLDAINAFGDLIGDDPLSKLIGGLDTAITNVSSFAGAVQSTINSVLAPLQLVQQRVGTLIQVSGNTLGNLTTFGGLLPNTPISENAQKLTNATTSMTDASNLFGLRNTLGRMDANLVAANAPPRQIPVSGGNLYDISATQYGDATDWSTLARANNLTDPFILGQGSLSVPAAPDKNGGVLRF